MRTFVAALKSLRDLEEEVVLIVEYINSSLLLSHGIRRDTALIIIFINKNLFLKVSGGTLRQYRPDYNSARGVVLKALRRGRAPGIVVKPLNELRRVLWGEAWLISYARGMMLGDEIVSCLEKKTIVMPSAIQLVKNLLKEVKYIRIEPPIYTEPQAIVIINNILDRCKKCSIKN